MHPLSLVYGDVCSGISAPTVAWHPLGWRAAFYAEVAKFPSTVLAKHHPHVPNRGDFTQIQAGDYEPIDLLVGGTPCQDFSVAGLRAGMDGARGQLTVEFALLAGRLRPRWLVYENVPGVLSSDGGRAFGTFLGILGQLGYGVAYRVLDAQHFGVPQRRRRVFVVGHLGDWRRAAAVLFERHSLSGHPAPRRKAGKDFTYDVAPCLGASGRGFERTCDTRGQDCVMAETMKACNASGGWSNSADHAAAGYMIPVASTGDIAHCLNAGGMGRQDYETETLVTAPLTQNPYADNESRESLLVTHALRGEGFDASEDGTGRGTPLVPVAYALNSHAGCADGEQTNASHTSGGPVGFGLSEEVAYSLRAGRTQTVAAPLAFTCKDHGADAGELSPTLRSMGHDGSHANGGGQIAVAFDTSQITSKANRSQPKAGDPCHPLAAGAHPPAIAMNLRGREGGAMPEMDTLASLRAASGGSSRSYAVHSICLGSDPIYKRDVAMPQTRRNGDPGCVQQGMAVRRLTPRECERLQGFPDDYTKVNDKTADGPRYKALGNSMAVPVMRWIGERIALVESVNARRPIEEVCA